MTQSTPRVRGKSAAPSDRSRPPKIAGLRLADGEETRQWAMLQALSAFRDGDFKVRLPTNWGGLEGRIAETFNQALAHEQRISEEVARLSALVGKEGRLAQRMSLPGAVGGWATKVDSINTLLDDLVRPTTEVARTIGAVAKGDLGQSMALEVDGRELRGEFLGSAKLVNTMIEQLSVFTSEVTRVAREVGTEGKLGGQAKVKGVSGVWKDLTESVNQMANNLTAQVRNIADVTIAVANGDLSKKITVERSSVVELLGHDDIEIVTAGTGEEALTQMKERPFDCVVLDLRLPDMTGFTLLEKMRAEPRLVDVPVVVFTGKDLKPDEQSRLKLMAKSIVLKDVQSPERLLDETALFLHRVVTDLPPHKQAMIERLHSSREVLRNRKVLVVDDDVRNIFALTALLENHDVQVLSTTNGKGAIELIRNTPDLSLVLMDIMMPEMDGYETMREIRKLSEFRTLPILALTAKAMKGDREKCLDAGASDYISKPVNTDQLLSLMRVWLFR